MHIRIFAVVLLGCTSTMALADNDLPKVRFQYSSEFNPACTVVVQKQWIEEAKTKELLFSRLWENESPALFGFFYNRFHGGFASAEYVAKLSACPSTESYSKPLVLNISRFLESYTGPDSVNPDYAFMVLSFHELMHNWIDNNLKNSKLLEKYRTESRVVKVHLHLMAIEQYVYEGLGRKDLLSWIERKYPSIGGDYARAWQIVNEEEAEAFLQEL